MAVTIKQIAELAGVSVASVSNVINGNYHKVSQETRRRIEAIIEETGYRPNALARSLSTHRSRIISLVIPYISDEHTFNINPYYTYLIAQVERYVRRRDYYLMIRCLDDCHDIQPLLASLNVDGAFFTGVIPSDIGIIRSQLKCPAVFLDTFSDEEVVSVGINDYRGGYLSAQYLLNRGHRKIAFAGPRVEQDGVIWERFSGFRDACSEYGVSIGRGDVFEVDTIESNSVVTGQDIALSKKRFTAVSVMSDVSACGIIEGLHQCGLRVPEDISVIGFDGLPIGTYSSPKLTTVSQDLALKVRTAGEYLFRMIDSKQPLKISERLPVKLVERESVKILL